MTVEERLNELEVRYTLQQDQLESLSSVVWGQQKTIDALVQEVRSLREKLEAVGGASPITSVTEGPPPHY